MTQVESQKQRRRRGFLKAALGKKEKLQERLTLLKHPIYPDILTQKQKVVKAIKQKRKRAGVPPLNAL